MNLTFGKILQIIYMVIFGLGLSAFGYLHQDFQYARTEFMVGFLIPLLLYSFGCYRILTNKKAGNKVLTVVNKADRITLIGNISLSIFAVFIGYYISRNTSAPPNWVGAFLFGFFGALLIMTSSVYIVLHIASKAKP